MILAIDDDPGRYDYLAILLERRPGAPALRIVSCAECVATWLPHASAVLLDYDLDGVEICEACGERVNLGHKSSAYLPDIIARRVPVVVTSCSHPDNRIALHKALDEAGVRVANAAADHQGCEFEWLGQLWVWGVL